MGQVVDAREQFLKRLEGIEEPLALFTAGRPGRSRYRIRKTTIKTVTRINVAPVM